MTLNSWQEEHEAQVKFGNTNPEVHKREKHIQFQARSTVLGNTCKLLPATYLSMKESGYMNFLRVLQEQKQEVIVIKSNGEVVKGVIKVADSETISLICPIPDTQGKYRTRVLFKHQIAEFSPTKGIESFVDELCVPKSK